MKCVTAQCELGQTINLCAHDVSMLASHSAAKASPCSAAYFKYVSAPWLEAGSAGWESPFSYPSKFHSHIREVINLNRAYERKTVNDMVKEVNQHEIAYPLCSSIRGGKRTAVYVESVQSMVGIVWPPTFQEQHSVDASGRHVTLQHSDSSQILSVGK